MGKVTGGLGSVSSILGDHLSAGIVLSAKAAVSSSGWTPGSDGVIEPPVQIFGSGPGAGALCRGGKEEEWSLGRSSSRVQRQEPAATGP